LNTHKVYLSKYDEVHSDYQFQYRVLICYMLCQVSGWEQYNRSGGYWQTGALRGVPYWESTASSWGKALVWSSISQCNFCKFILVYLLELML